MDFKNLITVTPSNGIDPRQYVENIWKACDDEPHFFTYLMQTLHFLAHEFELLPREQYSDEIEEAVAFTNPMTGEFYSSYMSTFPDNPFGVCFGIRKTATGALEFAWFNIVRHDNKIYAFNPCRLKDNTEDSMGYLGIQIPTLMITKQIHGCRAYWDMLEKYIKEYEELLPFITPEQAQRMAEEERKREAQNLQTIMSCVGDFINGLPIGERDNAINVWNAAQR